MLVCSGSQCGLLSLEIRWLCRLPDGVEVITIGSVVVVLIQLPLWKSVGNLLSVFVGTESDPTSF